MKNLFLSVVVFIPIISFGAIDEQQIDVYFANGIDTEEWQAKKNSEILDRAILEEMPKVYEKYLGQVGQTSKVGYAYNQTNGKVLDISRSHRPRWECIYKPKV